MKPRAGFMVPAGLVLALLAVQAAGICAGHWLLPTHGGALAPTLLSWDGRIYFGIMQQGYGWNPARPLTAQSIAFFPAQPILDWAGALVAGRASPVPPLVISLTLGIASVFAFHGLARRLLNPPQAGFATALFALWPASSFFIMGYPTGLISLCLIGALGAHLRGAYWRAALWCGLGSAAGPTVIFVVAALYVSRGAALLRQGITARRVAQLAGWALLSVSGLLAFMLYQQWRFHDALAFHQAQSAWGTAPALGARLHRLVDWRWYVQQADAGRHEIAQGWRFGGAARISRASPPSRPESSAG